MAAETLIAFSILTFTFAYLAIQTPEEHGPLQIFNYILVYLSTLFTGFLAYSFNKSGENPAGLLMEWNNSFSWILYMVVAYFFVYMLWKAFELYSTNTGGN